jgi:hypothetical protein
MSRLRFIAFRSTAHLAGMLLMAACGVVPISLTAQAATQSDGGWQAASSQPRNSQAASNVEWSPAAKSRAVEEEKPAAPPTNVSASISIKRTLPANTRANAEAAPSTQSSDTRWRLPNAATTNSSALDQQPGVAGAREPREFQAPKDARPLNTAQTVRRSAPPSFQPPTSANRVQQAAAAAPPKMQRPDNHRPRANSAPPVHSRPARRQPSPRRPTKRPSSDLWDTITVAFDAAESFAAEAENLPLPGSAEKSLVESNDVHVETMPDSHGEGYYLPGDDHQYLGDPYCADGVCETGCGCGCSAEVGCACEPGCGCPDGNCGSKDLCCIGSDDGEACHSVRIRLPRWQELTVFGGVHGFKGPYDRERDSGNFGFHEGFNAGFKIPSTSAGYQIGYRAVHSQLNGDIDTNIADPHTQQFFTAGIFQRAKDGIQFGIVWDMLRDERWGAVDFHQLRGEVSMIERGCHEIGLAAAMHLNDHEPFPADDETPSVLFQPTDQYLLFYRFHGPRGGEGRFYGGFNDDDDGIVGADMLVPLSDRWSLATGFTYLIPAEHAGREGASQEAWNIATALVWHWDCRARSSHASCYRPMFNVADNGSLIIDERLGAPATE